MSHPLYTNRLINEKSPYLLQHAHNPVDWYPWGDEAFDLAKKEDKPIFLSIGYATCHWCHIMEEESFANVEVATLMNETFVNIKVDREEKPDVDSLYMEFAQAMMSGAAGWPLNVLLTPDLMPFFGTTYMPADASKGFFGLKQLIQRIADIWRDPEEKQKVITQAGKIVDVFAANVTSEGTDLPSKENILEATELLFKLADPIYGGMKGTPKFPVGYQACFLLRQVHKTADSRALFFVERSLDMMHRGGIYDHLGGGFSRYSIDERWLIPHFEKMLYDNAILSRTYLETYRFTRQAFYREVVEHILLYIKKEMKGGMGGFFSAQDADSEGAEGSYYTWTWDEIQAALGREASVFCDYYGVSHGGNFEGRNVLHMPHTTAEFAKGHNVEPAVLGNQMKMLREKLLDKRKKRIAPPKDDKVIASYNGLMIYAFAEAGRAFASEEYLKEAEASAEFVQSNMWKDHTLFRRWREGEEKFEGCLDDYACLIHGLLSLFEAGRGTKWLKFALELTAVLKEDFKSEGGAFYLTNGKDPSILLRRCEFYDGAEPSGNAVHAENLVRLFQITQSKDFQRQAADILKAAKQHIEMYPPGACYHLIAMMRFFDEDAPTLVIALNEKNEYRQEISKLLMTSYQPHLSCVWRETNDEVLFSLVPKLRDKIPVDGKTTLYLCRQGRCEEPITELPKMFKALEKL